MNVDQSQEIAGQYRIMSIPTLMFFKDGKAIDTIIGAVPEETLQSKMDDLL